MIKNFKSVSVKKIITFAIGILVAAGIFQQSDVFVKVANEIEDSIPEEVLVGDFFKDEGQDAATTSLLVLETDTEIETKRGPYPVIKVADGDTITVVIDGASERVRLLGIDAAETNKTDAILSECYAEAAKNELTTLLESAEYVYLEYDTSQGLRDKYDRLLAYVFIKNTETNELLFVNHYLVAEGFVYEYTYDKPYKYQKMLQDAEVMAYELERGLWGVCR